MRVPRIYTQQTLSKNAIVELEESASHHLIKVLRMDVDAPLIVFNGEGGEYTARIDSVSKKHATVLLDDFSADSRQSPIKTHLAIGLSRGERFDFVLQKACELGVTEITPLFTEHTEVKIPKERMEKKRKSWQQILVSSCEQNHRNILPRLNSAIKFDDFFQSISDKNSNNELRLVLHHRTEKKLAEHIRPESILLLVGPEGGLSQVEISYAESHRFRALALGPRVLRTETAPIAALSCIQYQWGDF